MCTHSHTYRYIYVCLLCYAHWQLFIIINMSLVLSHIECPQVLLPAYVSPLRRVDSNSNSNSSSYNNDNYILIQNAHLPHFNFHTLTSTSVLYLYLEVEERAFSLSLGLSLSLSLAMITRSSLLLQFGARLCSVRFRSCAVAVVISLRPLSSLLA